MITEIHGKVCEMYIGLHMQIRQISKELKISESTISNIISRYMHQPHVKTKILILESKANYSEQELLQIEADKQAFKKAEIKRKHIARRHIYYANQKKYRLAKKRLSNI